MKTPVSSETSSGRRAPPGRFAALAAVCFFISGACGLVYQVLWLRVLSLSFGNTTLAASTILSSYMAGLGLGALYFGRRIYKRPEHPVRLYAKLELGVGLYAFATPLLWAFAEKANLFFYRGFEPGYLSFSLFKFALSFLLLFLPTFLMGGTLPVLSAFLVRNREHTARYAGMLYALNTFGAVAGVLASAFYALHTLGLFTTLMITGALNVLLYLLLFRFDRENRLWDPAASSEDKEDGNETLENPRTKLPPRSTVLMLVFFGISGGVSMVYEVGWTRVLAMTAGSSVYAFAIMLSTFLFGIALGSALFSAAARRWKMGWETFALLEVLTGLSVIAGINLFDDLPFYFLRVYKLFKSTPLLMDLGRFLLCAAVMIVPTVLIGAIFTAFLNAYRNEPGAGRDVGSAYFANTAGTILGAALAGFVLIPAFGIQKSLAGGGLLNIAVGAAAYWIAARAGKSRALAAAFASIAAAGFLIFNLEPWNATVLAGDTAVKPDRVADLSRKEFREFFSDRELLFYREGMSATVSVARSKDNVSLAVNGKVDASTSDTFTQYLLGHLPMLLHEDPKDVLVIGLGSGSTAAAAAAYPVERIDVVELEKAVVEGSNYFRNLNRGVLEDPRANLIVNDGRNFLLLSPERYDVIISEPSNPWMAGVANLFSLEHFRTMRSRLKPGGIACQWLHAYSMSTDDLRMIIRTFTEAFEHTQLWGAYYPDIMLLGFSEKPAISIEMLEKRFHSNPLIRSDLAPHGVTGTAQLLGSYWLADEGLRKAGEGARLNTDDKPLLEYSAPRYLYTPSSDANYRFLNQFRDYEFQGFTAEPPAVLNAELLLGIAEGLAAKNQPPDTHAFLERAKQIDPAHPKIDLIAGMLAHSMDDKANAVRLLNSAVSKNPDLPLAFYYAGMANALTGDLVKAIPLLRRAAELEPENALWLRNYGHALFTAGLYDEAGPVYDKAIRAQGRDFESLHKMVDILLKSSNIPGQVLILETMKREYPKYAPAYLQLGSVFEGIGQVERAQKSYEEFIELMPEHWTGWFYLARLASKTGDEKAMRRALDKAIKYNPGLKDSPEVQKLLP